MQTSTDIHGKREILPCAQKGNMAVYIVILITEANICGRMKVLYWQWVNNMEPQSSQNKTWTSAAYL